MRIAFVSDIHGNLAALEAVARDIARRGIDEVVNLGDSLSGPLLPSETAAYLMATDWFHLAGNHERQILSSGAAGAGASDAYARACLNEAQLRWIASLVPVARYRDDVHLCHGTPTSDIEYLLESVDVHGRRAATVDEVAARLGDVRTSLVVCGHSHVPRVARTESGVTVVNPGSVGLPAYDDDRPFPHVVENGSPDARFAIGEWQDGAWTTSLVAVPYDHESMARLADMRERPDWAAALRTGEMPRRRASPP